jgi:hypothetical protein
MKMYRVGDAHYVTQDDAKKGAKIRGLDWAAVDVPVKIRDLAEYLNDLVDGVLLGATPAPAAPRPDPVPTLNYTQQSLEIDDLWDTLPLARRLHFAALAVEDARTSVPALKVEPAPAANAADDLL